MYLHTYILYPNPDASLANICYEKKPLTDRSSHLLDDRFIYTTITSSIDFTIVFS